MHITTNHIVEAIALITAIAKYNQIKGTRYFFFIPVLAFVLIGELAGEYYGHYPNYDVPKNQHIYLMVSTVETLFLSYQFYKMINCKKVKMAILFSSLIVIFLSIVWFFSSVDLGNVLFNLWGISGFFLCSISCYFLYEKFVISEEVKYNIMKFSDFWFAIGVLIFFAGTTIPFMLRFYFKDSQFLILDLPLYRFFPRLFSVILYGSFTTAIILWKKNQK